MRLNKNIRRKFVILSPKVWGEESHGKQLHYGDSSVARRSLRMTCVFLVCVVLILFSTGARAQIDVNVYDEVVYSMLDKLVAAKLIKTYSPNQRPLSRYVVARLIQEAKDRAGTDISPVDWIFSELEPEFAPELKIVRGEDTEAVYIKPIDRAHLSWTATNQSEEPMPVNNLGTSSATVQPLLAYKDGQHYAKYGNFYADTVHWLYASPYFAAYLQPQMYSYSGPNSNGGARLYRGYLKAGIGDFEFQIGRDDLIWGPGKHEIFFSNNARALDMIKLTSPSAFRFPWFFKYLGQWRFTTFFSWLGDGAVPDNTILSGYRLDFQPFNWWWWDIGFDHAVMMGGKGAKDPSVKDAIIEYIGFIGDSGLGSAASNHLMGLDMTLTVPQLAGAQIYGKFLLDDTQAEYIYMLTADAIWLGGLYLPKIPGVEKLSARAEFVYGGQFYGRHGFYSDGWTLDNKSIGYDAGSDTYSGMLDIDYIFNTQEFARLSSRYLYRSSNKYVLTYSASGNNNGIAVSQYGPVEHHMMLTLAGQKKITSIFNIYAEAGIDAVKNKGFAQGDNAVEFATQIKLVFHDLTK